MTKTHQSANFFCIKLAICKRPLICRKHKNLTAFDTSQ